MFYIKLNQLIYQYLIVIFSLFSSSQSWAQIPNHQQMPKLSSMQMAEMYHRRGEYGQAIKIYRSLLESGERGSVLFRGLIRSWSASGKNLLAKEFIQEFIGKNPDCSGCWYGSGYINYLEKRNIEAEKDFNKAIELNPANAMAWNNLGAVKTRTKSYTLAVKDIKEAIRLDPNNPMFFNNLWIVYGEMRDNGLFFAEFEDYVLKGPRKLAVGYGKIIAQRLRQKGFSAYSKGNLEEALKQFQDMVAIYRKIDHKPGLVQGLFSLGLLLEEKGEASLALEKYRQLLEINPNHIQARKKLKEN
jgi:tetratricopeptide (TPR) repeat protein